MAAMQWVDPLAPELEYRGLVGERRALLHRVPATWRERLPADTWMRLCAASGVRVAFRTDSATIAVRAEWLSQQTNRANAEIDLYQNGQFHGQLRSQGLGTAEGVVYDGPSRDRCVELYMPPYGEVRFAGVGVAEDACIRPPPPLDGPRLLFYGDSITHGSTTVRPGTTYPARIARSHRVDFVNLGVGGSARGEPAMAEIAASLRADVIVLAFGVNTFGSSYEEPRAFERTYDTFLAILRWHQPEVPILIVTPLFHTCEFEQTTRGGAKLEEYRRVIREVVYRRQSFGDANLILLEGHGLIGPGQGDLLADHVHPNDAGFAAIANALGAQIQRVLSLTSSKT
ncbi:MAG: GDSL-type esterase/lipase family protein [Chloroflexi bacterium]|nr:GDSL-type esterase/lipase family protein [Chloroflexota bacterium]